MLSDKTEKGINEGVFGGKLYFQVGGRIAPVTQQVGEGDEDNDECVSDTAARERAVRGVLTAIVGGRSDSRCD